MSKVVKVAVYRQKTEQLFRVANVDYPACVRVSELRNWQRIARLVLDEAEGMECKRAKPYDVEQFGFSIGELKERLAGSEDRISQLEAIEN